MAQGAQGTQGTGGQIRPQDFWSSLSGAIGGAGQAASTLGNLAHGFGLLQAQPQLAAQLAQGGQGTQGTGGQIRPQDFWSSIASALPTALPIALSLLQAQPQAPGYLGGYATRPTIA